MGFKKKAFSQEVRLLASSRL